MFASLAESGVNLHGLSYVEPLVLILIKVKIVGNEKNQWKEKKRKGKGS